MAYKDKRTTVKLPTDLANEIIAQDLVGSLTDKVIWLLRQQLKQRLAEAGKMVEENRQ